MSSTEVKTFALNFAIAGATSAVAKTIIAPFERVKLILQTQSSALQILTGEREKYKGIIDCFIRIPKEQGYLSFWRGNGINVIRYFPTQALNFSFYDYFKHLFYETIGKDTPAKATFVKFLAGGLAGTCATAIIYPVEFCQTKIAVDIGTDKSQNKKNKAQVEREYCGFSDCLRKVHKTEGIRGWYRGCVIAILGVTFYRAFYFGLFDGIKRYWTQENIPHHHEVKAKVPLFLALIFAQCVTCIAGTITYPLDTVGRRLMMESGRPKKLLLFNTTLGAIKYMYQNEGGINAFYRGITANCLRGMSGALVLVFYDEVLHYTKWKELISSCDNC